MKIKIRVPSRTTSFGYSELQYEDISNYYSSLGQLILMRGAYQAGIFAAGQWMSVEYVPTPKVTP